MSRIDKLEKYRGFPIPFIVHRDAAGTPHFKINDEDKVIECIQDKLCSVCGEPHENDMWFIGGPMSAFHPNGAYIDTPIHKECGVFALQNCPYMVYTKYQSKTPTGLLDLGIENMLFFNPTLDSNRLEYFVFIRASGYRVHQKNRLERFIYPTRPYLEVEYWKDGTQLIESEVLTLNSN